MIGTYASFKGKLKVGDRVRVEYGGRTSLGEVNETSESGFTVRENMDEWRCVERFIFWTSEGTLELLSPSLRVVTLETLEPGDEVRTSSSKLDKNVYTCADVSKNGKVVFLADPDHEVEPFVRIVKDLADAGWQPVQPASPPAPTEEEEEPVEFMECDTCRAKPGTPPLCRGCLHNRKIIKSLNKPAGAGEK